LVMRPVMAGENLESRFVKWREDSTLISGSAARALIQRQFIALTRAISNKGSCSLRR
jgi:hypothetical protein